ncbi:hypothetical protein KFL_002870060 [Klebsormidium nitens]|uniref:Vacuolar protein 8 n=1 Tax=Klebsormidium nitens TaxID=105231 RepID=A0A1Y1I8X4_KLENI|nr:hypothetical protein KFL_002870060 [Klebsormidium nitens]|eukprot:GAQ86402.1 hypothetical protein KFL_002870060 [Klebsormidium nitens]
MGNGYTWTVMEEATRALANLALEPSSSRAIARARGAVARLVPLLRSSSSAAARTRAARAVVNLTCKAENRKRRFGAWALGNLAHGPKLKARIVAEPGCLRGLVALLESGEARVQERAARALANLAFGAGSKKAIAAVPGAFEGLVRLKESSSAEVRGQVKRAIKNLGSGHGKCEERNQRGAGSAVNSEAAA